MMTIFSTVPNCCFTDGVDSGKLGDSATAVLEVAGIRPALIVWVTLPTFNPNTIIEFTVPDRLSVKLQVYTRGQRKGYLVDKTHTALPSRLGRSRLNASKYRVSLHGGGHLAETRR